MKGPSILSSALYFFLATAVLSKDVESREYLRKTTVTSDVKAAVKNINLGETVTHRNLKVSYLQFSKNCFEKYTNKENNYLAQTHQTKKGFWIRECQRGFQRKPRVPRLPR